jgi:hypothetical protein
LHLLLLLTPHLSLFFYPAFITTIVVINAGGERGEKKGKIIEDI